MDSTRTRSDLDLSPPGGDGPASSDPVLWDAAAEDATPPVSPLEQANADVRDRLWAALAMVYRARWFILTVTVLAAALAVYLTLQIPNRYKAETRVLLPEGGDGLLAGALNSISPTAAALIGGGGGGFTRYMAILTSPTTLGSVVDRFDLVSVYELEDEENPRQRAIAQLYERAEFEVSIEYDFLGVYVLDEDPTRAAQMANFFVERLNERHIDLTSSSAASNRQFLEARLTRAYADLDSAQAALQGIQERSGVIEPEAQAGALMEALARGQGQVALAEAQYQALLSQYGPENTDVQAAQAALTSARRQVAQLSAGGDAVMPVPLRQLPRVQRQYQGAMQEMLIQKQIVETILPQYEMAALQEKRDADAVQVLDTATPPTRKAEPRRSIIVIAATLSAFLLAVVFVIGLGLARQTLPGVRARLRAA